MTSTERDGLLADLAEIAWFEVDADRNVVAVSPALESMTGFRAGDVVGRSCLTLIRCQECLRECSLFKRDSVRAAELTIYRADGSELDVVKSGQVVRNGDGKITGALEVLHRKDECSHNGPPPELSSLLGALGRAALIADGELKLLGASARVFEHTGFTPAELQGQPVAALLGEELFGDPSPFRAAVLAGERREGWRAFLRRKEGSALPVSLTVGAIDPTDHCGTRGARVSIMLRIDEQEQAPAPAFAGIVSRSPAMQRIFRIIELMRDTDSTVLITGESGTGKELVARAIHSNSHRSSGPFVAVNCAAIPAELLESELFGHVRGAFTGAVRDRAGRFELADGGTLFLDEIGDLALSLQAKLLRVLQERKLERVGENRTRTVNVRLLAATNVNLVRAVAERRFREDLYYRLRVVPIDIPPLRERREDVDILIRHLLDEIGRGRGRAFRIAPSAGRALLAYTWPGNVRELQNALEFAATVCPGQTIHVNDLPAEIVAQNPDAVTERVEVAPASGASDDAEIQRIRTALEQAHYRRDRAAEILGLSRTTLWRKMRELRM